jgi:uncharacterized protein (DUF433 family)
MGATGIIDCGGGPRIAGTRITVYAVLEYVRAGRTRDWIAATLNLSSEQVQTALDYVDTNAKRINAEYDRILARIRQGNSPEVEALLRANRKKVRVRLRQKNSRNVACAGNNGCLTSRMNVPENQRCPNG